MATPYQATIRRGKKRKYRARQTRRQKQRRLRAAAAFKPFEEEPRAAQLRQRPQPANFPALPAQRHNFHVIRWALLWLLLLISSLHELPVQPKIKPTPEIPARAESQAIARTEVPSVSILDAASRTATLQPRLEVIIPPKLSQPRKAAPLVSRAPELAFSPPMNRIDETMLPSHEMLETPAHIRWERMALVQAATLGMGGYGFVKYNGLFGKVGQPFKIGNDLTKDHTLLFDEVMHFQGSYRITQAVAGVYQWAGVPKSVADWIGAGTSAFIMTALEYVDGRRVKDEASYSDLVANFAGIGFALAKTRVSFLQDFDLRFSYLTPADPFRHDTVKRYERMTHWLTYDLNRKLGIPLHLGFGYGVRHPFQPKVKPQYFVGIGLSPLVILSHLSPPAAKTLEFLRFYHFGNRMQI